jgi:hypothetical protein
MPEYPIIKEILNSQLLSVIIGAGLTWAVQLLFTHKQNKKDDKKVIQTLCTEIIGNCEKIKRIALQLETCQLRLHYNHRLQHLAFYNTTLEAKADFSKASRREEYFQRRSDELGLEFEILRADLQRLISNIGLLVSEEDRRTLEEDVKESSSINLFARFKNGAYRDITETAELYRKIQLDVQQAAIFHSVRGIVPALNKLIQKAKKLSSS